MTDYHEILGVEKNASREEIRQAYENQVEKMKKEVFNEKRLNQFLKLFDEAYEALISLEENQLIDNNETMFMSPQEVQKRLMDDDESNNHMSGNDSKGKRRSAGTRKNDFAKKRVAKSKDKKNGLNDVKEERYRKQKAAEKSPESDDKQTFGLMMLPFKILALPLIAILSAIILLCHIIYAVSWIASKVLIVGAISAGAIHLYQVEKLGQPMNYNILILAAAVLVASFFLPYVLKFVLKVFETLNNALKKIVF